MSLRLLAVAADSMRRRVIVLSDAWAPGRGIFCPSIRNSRVGCEHQHYIHSSATYSLCGVSSAQYGAPGRRAFSSTASYQKWLLDLRLSDREKTAMALSVFDALLSMRNDDASLSSWYAFSEAADNHQKPPEDVSALREWIRRFAVAKPNQTWGALQSVVRDLTTSSSFPPGRLSQLLTVSVPKGPLGPARAASPARPQQTQAGPQAAKSSMVKQRRKDGTIAWVPVRVSLPNGVSPPPPVLPVDSLPDATGTADAAVLSKVVANTATPVTTRDSRTTTSTSVDASSVARHSPGSLTPAARVSQLQRSADETKSGLSSSVVKGEMGMDSGRLEASPMAATAVLLAISPSTLPVGDGQAGEGDRQGTTRAWHVHGQQYNPGRFALRDDKLGPPVQAAEPGSIIIATPQATAPELSATSRAEIGPVARHVYPAGGRYRVRFSYGGRYISGGTFGDRATAAVASDLARIAVFGRSGTRHEDLNRPADSRVTRAWDAAPLVPSFQGDGQEAYAQARDAAFGAVRDVLRTDRPGAPSVVSTSSSSVTPVRYVQRHKGKHRVSFPVAEGHDVWAGDFYDRALAAKAADLARIAVFGRSAELCYVRGTARPALNRPSDPDVLRALASAPEEPGPVEAAPRLVKEAAREMREQDVRQHAVSSPGRPRHVVSLGGPRGPPRYQVRFQLATGERVQVGTFKDLATAGLAADLARIAVFGRAASSTATGRRLTHLNVAGHPMVMQALQAATALTQAMSLQQAREAAKTAVYHLRQEVHGAGKGAGLGANQQDHGSETSAHAAVNSASPQPLPPFVRKTPNGYSVCIRYRIASQPGFKDIRLHGLPSLHAASLGADLVRIALYGRGAATAQWRGHRLPLNCSTHEAVLEALRTAPSCPSIPLEASPQVARAALRRLTMDKGEAAG